jgi:NCS1 family nucleobase:cation symporter-1
MHEGADASLINEDIRPTRADERHWSVLNMASLWVGMVVCVPTYMLAGGLVQQGMNWAQAVVTILLGNLIVLVPMVLNGHPGTRYGIPFPVLARASFGVHGAHVPSLLRAVVAAGWFGIQTWVGGAAIYQLLNALFGGALSGDALPVLGINLAEFLCFVLFWVIQLVIIYRGIESIRILETAAAPFLLVMGLVLLVWAYRAGGGFGEMLSSPGQFGAGGAREGEFWRVFVPSVTGMVGFWATLSLNIPDFTRYARSQRDQILGQALGLPTTMTLFAFIGVAVTSATPAIFATTQPDGTVVLAEPIWDPVVLLGRMGGGVSVLVSLFALSVATLSTNIAANVVSPANALVNVNPRRLSFRLGGYITAAIGIAMFPWKLMADPSGYIFVWLIGYSALLGPIGGILIVDYFVLRSTALEVEDLYRVRGRYYYRGGFNVAALLAFGLAVLPNIPGFLHQTNLVESVPAVFDTLYTYAWFVGFFVAGLLYFGLMKMSTQASLLPVATEAGER